MRKPAQQYWSLRAAMLQMGRESWSLQLSNTTFIAYWRALTVSSTLSWCTWDFSWKHTYPCCCQCNSKGLNQEVFFHIPVYAVQLSGSSTKTLLSVHFVSFNLTHAQHIPSPLDSSTPHISCDERAISNTPSQEQKSKQVFLLLKHKPNQFFSIS